MYYIKNTHLIEYLQLFCFHHTIVLRLKLSIPSACGRYRRLRTEAIVNLQLPKNWTFALNRSGQY